MEKHDQPKISSFDATILIIVAVIFDLFNWIPIINIFITFVSLVGFQLYFFLKGVKKAKYSLAGNVFELVPALSILPAITAGVVATIIAQRILEKKENLIAKKTSGE